MSSGSVYLDTVCTDLFPQSMLLTIVILQTHKIKKFVLHTNYPGHADFNSYIKCNFVIQGLDCISLFVFERLWLTLLMEKLMNYFSFLACIWGFAAVNNSKNITPSTKWDQVKV